MIGLLRFFICLLFITHIGHVFAFCILHFSIICCIIPEIPLSCLSLTEARSSWKHNSMASEKEPHCFGSRVLATDDFEGTGSCTGRFYIEKHKKQFTLRLLFNAAT